VGAGPPPLAMPVPTGDNEPVATLSDDQVRAGLERLPGWSREGDAIVKTYELPAFLAAIDFVQRIATLAERADHHPDLDIRYRRVRVALSTHDAGGLTEKDLALAREIEAVAEPGA
jgi:4a-hydroxytetrahydrobiopterin dehydratase